MEKFNQLKLSDVHVHLIHTIAITTVILVHAAGRWPMTSQELNQLPPLGIASWTTVLIYQCLGVLGVPLFLMLTGLLLMHPEKMQIEKNESLRKFFKKRLTRIGLPFIFWTIIYFIWIHLTQNISLTPGVIIQGTLNGAYTQFWYIYALIGLYLLTPLLRVIIAHANKTPSQTLIKYFIGLWLIGASILPFFSLIFPYQLNHNVFTITGYVGYYVLGAYLCSIQPIDRKKALTLMLLGISLTALGTYVLMTSGAGTSMYYFQAYHSPTVILASVMAFLLLLTIKPTSHQQETTPPHQQKTTPSILNKLITTIGQNTLGIFFVHVIVIETIQRGYLGFILNH
ncbi:MAG: acyltransferase family protein, partial [Nitrososphaerota archaeon]|nr:acyltransferase family protein [Nitrososphaerota archaeon]